MKVDYCDVCKQEVNTNVQVKEESYEVKGELIKVKTNVRVCAECGNNLFDEQLDQQTLETLYNEYRKSHSMLMPDEIKSIREMYGLSQRAFAKLLNFGDRTINRYENGGLQDQAHNSLLKFLRDPKNMKDYIENNVFDLDNKRTEILIKRVNDLIEENFENHILDDITRIFSAKGPDVYNGYKNFDIEMFRNVILFFAERCHIYKVKLLKLLFYSDFLYFKNNCTSLTGSVYVHLPYGPVPDMYELLLEYMRLNGDIEFNYTFYIGYETSEIINKITYDESKLGDEEISTLNYVLNNLKDKGSVEISNMLHQEKGFIDTLEGQKINYEYAFCLKAV